MFTSHDWEWLPHTTQIYGDDWGMVYDHGCNLGDVNYHKCLPYTTYKTMSYHLFMILFYPPKNLGGLLRWGLSGDLLADGSADSSGAGLRWVVACGAEKYRKCFVFEQDWNMVLYEKDFFT